MSYVPGNLKIDFSFKREVFFVVVGSFFGGIVMMLPDILYRLLYDHGSFYAVWIIFGHAIGVYSQYTILAGVVIHLITASCIGIVLGIFLYKTGILEISKPLNGLIYGLFAAIAVFLLWSIPIQQLVLSHINAAGFSIGDPSLMVNQVSTMQKIDFVTPLIHTFIRNIVFGMTLGLTSSYLSIKLGKRFRCPKCVISFSRLDAIKRHLKNVHDEHIQQKRVVILGGGFGGVEVLKKVQKAFENDPGVDISLVNKDNFLLFTPMLHEAISGMIEPTHLAIPLRSFCKRSRFIEAEVQKIDIENNRVYLRNNISVGKLAAFHNNRYTYFSIDYDYLIISLGGRTNYYGDKKIEDLTFSMKTLYDANYLRSHIITTLELADTLNDNDPTEFTRKKNLLTYIVVGGGFSGVETVGEINEFIRASIKQHYFNINLDDLRIILVSSSSKILPEMGEKLGRYAQEELEKSGVEIICPKRVKNVIARDYDSYYSKYVNHTKIAHEDNNNSNNDINSPLGLISSLKNRAKYIDYLTTVLDNDARFNTYTVIWTAGVAPEAVFNNIACEKDKKGRLITNSYLQVKGFENVFALGDCASVMDPETGNPCPPTAQHAIRQGEVTGTNVISIVKGDLENKIYTLSKFNYKTRGTMATVGKRKGVAVIFGIKLLGVSAWMIWRAFYLRKIPVRENRLRVLFDWTIDLLFSRDIARLRSPVEIQYSQDDKLKKDHTQDKTYPGK